MHYSIAYHLVFSKLRDDKIYLLDCSNLDAKEDTDCSSVVRLVHADISIIAVPKIKPAALYYCCLCVVETLLYTKMEPFSSIF